MKQNSLRNNTVAIIIGIGSYNDLGLIRSCGEAGIKSIYLIHRESLVVPIYKSKYVIEHAFIDINNLESVLLSFESKYPEKQFIVFPASDDAVVAMDRLKESLSTIFQTSHANGNVIELMDKDLMGHQAQKAGLTVPQTSIIKLSGNEVSNIEYPVILKPVQSIAGEKSDITVCHNSEELNTALTDLGKKGYKNILCQRYLHNDSSKEIGITGVSYPDGSVEIHGYIDKIRNRSNINNFGIYHPVSDFQVEEALKNYIKSTGYVGIFDTDFILFNGKLYFIECNFRNGAYGYCVTKGGFNMPYAFASDVFSLQKSKSTKLKIVTFMEERTDILNILDRTLPLGKWLNDLIRTNTFLWWNWKDPKPMLRIPYFIKKLFKA